MTPEQQARIDRIAKIARIKVRVSPEAIAAAKKQIAAEKALDTMPAKKRSSNNFVNEHPKAYAQWKRLTESSSNPLVSNITFPQYLQWYTFKHSVENLKDPNNPKSKIWNGADDMLVWLNQNTGFDKLPKLHIKSSRPDPYTAISPAQEKELDEYRNRIAEASGIPAKALGVLKMDDLNKLSQQYLKEDIKLSPPPKKEVVYKSDAGTIVKPSADFGQQAVAAQRDALGQAAPAGIAQ